MTSAILTFPGATSAKTAPVLGCQQRAGRLNCALMGDVLRFAPRRHGLLCGLAIGSAPLLYTTLELPKWIVNGALGTGDALPALFQSMAPVTLLASLCAVQLAALASLSAVKFTANVMAANLGERFLRHMRLSALRQWRRTPRAQRGGGIAPVLTAEMEAVAGFSGSAVWMPVTQLIAFATVMTFLVAQDWRLAVAAIALTPVQAVVVPVMQRRITALRKARIATIRGMCASLVSKGETIAPALRAARTAQTLRFEIHARKFALKAVYNMIGHLTPLAYLSVGGWLVLTGDLTPGALVAALAAYREGAGPMRELFGFYMRWVDARARYQAVCETTAPVPALTSPDAAVKAAA
ncbi:MAG: ABC transporter transmembrane domain-containing protein [Pseudomonadota bacterium]